MVQSSDSSLRSKFRWLHSLGQSSDSLGAKVSVTSSSASLTYLSALKGRTQTIHSCVLLYPVFTYMR